MKKIRVSALLLAAVFTLTFSSGAVAAFVDLPDDHQYKTAIDYCQLMGFVKGTSATTFEPDAKLSRAHFATIWARSLQFSDDNHTFSDVTRLHNYYDIPMIVLYSKGILNGTTTTTASPHQFVTREQLAVITQRTHKLGVAEADDYMRYTDATSISEYARDSVSACINAGVFHGLFDGDTFNPARAVTRAELCKLVYNLNSHAYDITVAEMENGTVVPSVTKARAGTTVTLDVQPGEGMRLVEGSLKFNDTEITNDRFTMPASDVVITAEFEEIPPKVVESITILTLPQTEYTVGEQLDTTGLTLTAFYTDQSTAVLTEGFTTDPDNGVTLEAYPDDTGIVTVSYTEDEVTVTTTFEITVTEEAESPEPEN